MTFPPHYHEFQYSVRSYTVGWFAPLACERAAAEALRDEVHGPPEDFQRAPDDHLEYSWGKMGDHNFVLASLGAGTDGLVATAQTATRMLASFPSIRFSLLVGIGGAIPRFNREGDVYRLRPDPDVRLGDVVVSQPDGNGGGVIQYDHYKATKDGPQAKDSLDRPPPALLYGLAALQAKHLQSPSNVPNIIADLAMKNSYMVNKRGYKHPGQKKDRLFYPSYAHPEGDLNCEDCSAQHEVKRNPRETSDLEVYYGTIASGNVVVKNAEDRENLIKHHPSASKCLCYEMEAAGVMNNFPCLVIRGICDYADSHKNDVWHNYAALVAAAFAKELLLNMARDTVEEAVMARDWMEDRVNMIARDTMKNEIERTLKTTNTYSKSADIQSTLQSVNLDINKAGQWFLNSNKFRHWRNSCGSLLWVYGLPGSGKTVLSASVINYLQSNLALKNASRVVLHYYFDFQELKKDGNLRPLGCMLRSFLIQLSRTHDYMLEDLYKRLRTFQGELCERKLGEMLFQMTALHSDVKIVIDALDEMEDRQRETVCGWITETLKFHPDRFSFLATSRRERDIEEQLHRKCESLEMSADCDIEKYLLARIKGYRLNKGQRWSKESLRKIQDVLLERANGMFQWVVCQLDQLLDHPQTESFGDDEIDEVLRTLPQDLTNTYDQILERIPKQKRDAAYRLLQILLFCQRPIGVLEANEFLSVKCSGFNVSKRIKYPREVTRYCSSLVTLREPHSEDSVCWSTEIVLAHASVRDYLLFNRAPREGQVDSFGELEANKAIFKTCLQYIYFLSTLDGDPYSLDWHKRFPLANYATRYLFEHATAAGTEEETVKAVTAFFRSGDAFRTWMCHKSAKTARTFHVEEVKGHALMESVMQSSALYTAASYGLKYYLQIYLKRESYHVCKVPKSFLPLLGFCTTSIGSHQSISPLYAAAEAGHEDIVRMLIEAGFTVDEVGGPQGTALDVGCASGCVGVVEALLGNAKQRSTSTMWFEGALRQVVRAGSLQLVQVFLDHGFLTHSAQPSIESAIFDAALHGNTAVAQELLRHCRGLSPLADLSLPLSSTNTPSFLSRLSSWIPDVFSQSGGSSHEHSPSQSFGSYDRALDKRSKDAHFSRLLGEPVYWAHLFSTALQAAAFEGHEEIVEALLKEGRDPNATGGYFGTALQAAAAGGSPRVVQRLLDAGADPNATGGFFKTALNASLMIASWVRQGWSRERFGIRVGDLVNYKTVVAALLEAGALPYRGAQELRWALELGSHDAALDIIENAVSGAGQATGDFHTVATLLRGEDVADSVPLHDAISRGLSRVVESMIRNGAAIDVLDSCGRTPLHNAMRQKNQNVAFMVIQTVAQRPDAAALLKAKDSSDTTAVHYAAQLPVPSETIKHLLGAVEQAGALVECLDARRDGGRTALHCAMQQDNQDVALIVIQTVAQQPNVVSLLKAKDINGMTAVHYAAQKPVSSETMKHLLDAAEQAGILIECLDARCDNGRTALHYAPHNNSDDTSSMVQLLIDAAASAGILAGYVDVRDDRGETALHRAASCYDVCGITLLLRAGADEEAVNLDKENFVKCARKGSQFWRLFDVCTEAAGPFYSSMEEVRAIASITMLYQFVAVNDIAAVKEISRKATFRCSFLDIPDTHFGMTPLHRAAEKGYTAMGELLLDLGAQPEGVDKEKMTPLHRATRSGYLGMVTAILQRIGSEEKENRSLFSVTDLREADFNGFLTGRPSDHQDLWGNKPLDYAVQHKSIEMVKRLVHCGATMYKGNKEGNTPLDLVQEKREASYLASIKMQCDITAMNLRAEILEENEKYDDDS